MCFSDIIYITFPKYDFFHNHQEKSKKSASYQQIATKSTVNYKLLFPQAVPSRKIWRRPLWSANLRAQRFRAPEGGYILPFSRRVSVPCEGNRKGRKAYRGLVRMWSSPCRRDGEVEKRPYYFTLHYLGKLCVQLFLFQSVSQSTHGL